MEVPVRYFECWVCGIPFGLSTGFIEAATRQHTNFYCPKGCKIAFGPSHADELAKEKEQQALRFQSQLNEANHARLVAEKAAKSAIRAKRKVEQRIAHGVCPCCNKTFTNVANHMLTEHKDLRLPAGKATKQIEGAA